MMFKNIEGPMSQSPLDLFQKYINALQKCKPTPSDCKKGGTRGGQLNYVLCQVIKRWEGDIMMI